MKLGSNFETDEVNVTYQTASEALEQFRIRRYIVGERAGKWCVFRNETERRNNFALSRSPSFLKAVMISLSN